MRPGGAPWRRTLEARLEEARTVSGRLGRPVAATFTVEDPEPPDRLRLHAAAAGGPRFLWESGEEWRLGVGAAWTAEASGRDRLRSVERSIAGVAADLPGDASGSSPLWARPAWLGGFAFAPTPPDAPWEGFPAARFVLPVLQWSGRGGSARLTVAQRVTARDEPAALSTALERRLHALLGAEPRALDETEECARYRACSDRPHAAYRTAVERAVDAIRSGRFGKVVLARACALERAEGFSPTRVLRAFRAAHASCMRFAVGTGGADFLGATPERLLRLAGRRVTTAALAGSAPRGRSPEADGALARALRESKKEQEEHAFVVRALREGLAPFCDVVSGPEAPGILALDGIQHLHTPLEAELSPGRAASLLALAEALHPSPAVAGTPRAAALDWLARHEKLERGWYAGAVGFVTPEGEGELAVALRTALLRGREAWLHAGAGIVAGSEPAAELEETRLKLRAGLAALLEI